MDKFWEIKAKAGRKGELYLYGEIASSEWIGDEVTPTKFKNDLAALGEIDTLDVFINSPGGSVFAGFTLYNILKRYNAEKIMHVDGIAASAASYVLMAGNKIIMPQNTTIMIHNANAIASGNKADLRKIADELARIDEQMADIYAERTGQRRAAIITLMDAETWMTAKEAYAAGFCDVVEGNKQLAACDDLQKYVSKYKHPPKNVAALAAQRRTFNRIRKKILYAD